jgi:hypothetical protein
VRRALKVLQRAEKVSIIARKHRRALWVTAERLAQLIAKDEVACSICHENLRDKTPLQKLENTAVPVSKHVPPAQQHEQRPLLENAVRDWRIYADFAQHLIGIARRLYADEPLATEQWGCSFGHGRCRGQPKVQAYAAADWISREA